MSNYDSWKTETPEDEQHRLNRMWSVKPECYVCGSRDELIECGDSASIEFICENCREDEIRQELHDRDPEYDPMDKVERDEWERDFRDDR
jgi:superfamily II helicase